MMPNCSTFSWYSRGTANEARITENTNRLSTDKLSSVT